MCLNIVRSIMNWFATAHDDYSPPIVRGMRRHARTRRRAARSSTDDEIRAIWTAAEASGTFGGFVRLALLTAQRRAKVAAMRWADISDDGEWTIPREAARERYSPALWCCPRRRSTSSGRSRAGRQSLRLRRPRRWAVSTVSARQGSRFDASCRRHAAWGSRSAPHRALADGRAGVSPRASPSGSWDTPSPASRASMIGTLSRREGRRAGAARGADRWHRASARERAADGEGR